MLVLGDVVLPSPAANQECVLLWAGQTLFLSYWLVQGHWLGPTCRVWVGRGAQRCMVCPTGSEFGGARKKSMWCWSREWGRETDRQAGSPGVIGSLPGLPALPPPAGAHPHFLLFPLNIFAQGTKIASFASVARWSKWTSLLLCCRQQNYYINLDWHGFGICLSQGLIKA